MANKLEEKHQKILRALLQQPENKRCADCTAKGPVYANTTFNTFICTTCSGIHREFNHRVKSVSMATFKPEEIEALQKGGNQVAREKWLITYNGDDFPEPDPSDSERIRQFIKLKYIEKRWTSRGPDPQKQTKQRPPANVRTEPLQSVLGNDIPPIRVEPINKPPQHQQQQQQQQPQQLPPKPAPNQKPQTNIFFDPGFEANWTSTPQTQQQTTVDPFARQEPSKEDKSAALKNQITAMFQTQQQQQQQQQQMFPMGWQQQQMFPPQMSVQYPGQQIPGQFPVQQMPGQYPGQQIPGQFPGQQMPGQFPGQQIPGQFPGQQMPVQYPGQQIPGQYPGMTPVMLPGQYPGMVAQQQMFPPGTMSPPGATPWGVQGTVPPTVTPIKVEPEKPDPFASLSLSSLSKQATTQPQTKPAAPVVPMGTTTSTPNLFDEPNDITPKSNNVDPFGFSTSPPTQNGKSTLNDEFNPFGISQSSHVPPAKPATTTSDFNPFF